MFWRDVNKELPPFLEGKDYSANVWGWDGNNLLVVSLFYVDEEGYTWANCYGDVFGEAEFDDEYAIKAWQPIAMPELPR